MNTLADAGDTGRRGPPKQRVRVVALIPAGPNDDIVDTVESVLAYVSPSCAVVVIDDTGRPATARALTGLDARVAVRPSAGRSGSRGALFVKLADAYRDIADTYSFQALLRLDADSLVIGPRPEDDAIERFRRDPTLGMLGSYRMDCNGNVRRFWAAEHFLRRESGPLGLRSPIRRQLLRAALAAADAHGYEAGEHCQGCALLQSPACVEAMCRLPWFGSRRFLRSVIPEDHLFGLATVAAGFRLDDYATGDQPVGVQWRGLPGPPDELRRRNKKIIHSVRYWQNMNEAQIRADFARERRAVLASGGAGKDRRLPDGGG